ncbi:MAG: ATP-grasp domain-containing protein [Phycisphaerales bacterium]
MCLVNSPADVSLADDLSEWYPLLADLTPESVVFDSLPDADQIDATIGWPVFLKGVRQTSRHDASLAIANTADDLKRIAPAWGENAILASQRVAARVFTPLRPVEPTKYDSKLPRSFEFRTFWWRGQLVGAGPYWTNGPRYEWTASERRDAVAIAGEAARRINVGFLCLDVAQTAAGRWIVIEVNDGQRSGYAGVPRIALWQRVLDLIEGSPTSQTRTTNP